MRDHPGREGLRLGWPTGSALVSRSESAGVVLNDVVYEDAASAGLPEDPGSTRCIADFRSGRCAPLNTPCRSPTGVNGLSVVCPRTGRHPAELSVRFRHKD
jgi:hypothetical protein